MLGILILYFLAKPFYQLAERKGRSKWPWAISSIVVYYAGSFLGGIVIAFIGQYGFNTAIDDIDNVVLGLLAMPFGLLAAWLYFKFLLRKWDNDLEFQQQDILDENINLPG